MGILEDDATPDNPEDDFRLFLLCPVPEDQKPIAAYIGLKENSLTNWTTLSNANYQKKLRSLVLVFFATISFLRMFNWEDGNYGMGSNTLEWILTNVNLTCLFLVFLLIVIYVRWKQMEVDFESPYVFYEEGSWYDGQVWEKPLSILKNDRLLSSQEVGPILRRLTQSLCILFCWNIICTVLIFID